MKRYWHNLCPSNGITYGYSRALCLDLSMFPFVTGAVDCKAVTQVSDSLLAVVVQDTVTTNGVRKQFINLYDTQTQTVTQTVDISSLSGTSISHLNIKNPGNIRPSWESRFTLLHCHILYFSDGANWHRVPP